MYIYGINSDKQLASTDFERLASWITPTEQDRIRRFHRWQDAQSSLIGKVMIRSMLCKHHHINNEFVDFGENKYGKPYIKDREDIHFNISHSGEWIVCVMDHKPIGIDVERMKSIDMEIAKRFFSLEEYEDLMNLPIEQQLSYFYDLWTLKESYIKAEGKGLSIPLDSFSCVKKQEQWSISRGNPYFCKKYPIDQEYKLSICATHNNFPRSITVMDIEGFLSFVPNHS